MLSTVLTIKSKFKMLSTVLTLKFRERCMDLVSFESPEEYRHFALMLHRGERFSLQYRWLSAFLWSNSVCRQHQLDLDVWEEMQLQEQGLRRGATSADQHQRMVRSNIYNSYDISNIFDRWMGSVPIAYWQTLSLNVFPMFQVLVWRK